MNKEELHQGRAALLEKVVVPVWIQLLFSAQLEEGVALSNLSVGQDRNHEGGKPQRALKTDRAGDTGIPNGRHESIR
jgi:hypothetical protein